MKKLLAIILTLTMILSLAATVFAVTPNGSITIKDATNVSVDGKTFHAYKILDVEPKEDGKLLYTVPENMKEFYSTEFGVAQETESFDAHIIDKISKLTGDAFRDFAQKALDAAIEAGIEAKTAEGTEGVAQFTELDYGYYVIEDTSNLTGTDDAESAVMIDTTAVELNPADPNPVITLKADVPSVVKKILEPDSGEEDGYKRVDSNDASIGDTIKYEIVSHVPDMRFYKYYYVQFNDTMDPSLDYTVDSLQVTIGEDTLVLDEDYTLVLTNNNRSFEVKVVLKDTVSEEDGFEHFAYEEGLPIVVTYEATLNKDAFIINDNPDNSNDNQVTMNFSNNPNWTPGGSEEEDWPDQPTGITPPCTVKTYTTEVVITKVDNLDRILTGAEFQLTGNGVNVVVITREEFKAITDEYSGTKYYLLKDGTYTSEPSTPDTADTYANDDKTYKLETVTEVKGTKQEETIVKAFVGEKDGKVTFTGLGAGTYYLDETTVPTGYNGIGQIEFVITFTPADPENPSVSPAKFEISSEDAEFTTVNSAFATTITNKYGAELPSTGGIGTTIFYVVGGILLFGSAVLLITKKRVGAEF